LTFPKLEAYKEIAISLVAKICTAQAKADDGKKKQAKGAVEEQKNITEQIVVPYFSPLANTYKKKIEYIAECTSKELQIVYKM
jgi:hypothetical protein